MERSRVESDAIVLICKKSLSRANDFENERGWIQEFTEDWKRVKSI